MEEMTNETYKFKAKETLKGAWIILFCFLIIVWPSLIALCIMGAFHDRIFHAWMIFSLMGINTIFAIISYRDRNVVYEISPTKVLKRRGDKVLRCVELNDIIRVIVYHPICLKVPGQKDFCFRYINNKSTREKLISVLSQFGITEIERKKLNIPQLFLAFISPFIIVHFLGSVSFWIIGVITYLRLFRNGIDWLMLIHAIPAIVLFIASIAVLVYALKEKVRRAIILLAIVIIASLCCFFFETNNGYYQDYDETYFTWWWYRKHEETSKWNREKNEYKYGFIDKRGTVVIEPRYDTAGVFSEGLAAVGFRVDDAESNFKQKYFDPFEGITDVPSYKYGYIDKTGKMVIEPQFDTATDFSGGLAVVGFYDEEARFDENSINNDTINLSVMLFGYKYGYTFGYIDRTGKVLVEPQFDSASDFSGGMACVSIDGKYGYIDTKGKLVVPLRYDYDSGDFSEGFAVVGLEEKHGFIDNTGKMITEIKFDRANDFCDGLARVRIEGKDGYIDNTGNFVIDAKFDAAWNFSEGLARVRIEDKYGFIDKTGQQVIGPQFDRAWFFYDGLAPVMFYDKWRFKEEWGYIDKTGNIVITPKYYSAKSFVDGKAYVGTESGWGYRNRYEWNYIDKTGAIVPKPFPDHVVHFGEGLAEVKIDGKYGFIDKTGKIIIEPQFDTVDPFSEGLAGFGVEVLKTTEN
jgi:hypothetical protein